MMRMILIVIGDHDDFEYDDDCDDCMIMIFGTGRHYFARLGFSLISSFF